MALSRPSLARMIEDVLRAEIAAVRGGQNRSLPNSPWPDEVAIGPQGLGADSLELLTLAGAVNEQFHVHETGIEDALLMRRQFGDWVDLVARSRALSATRISFRTSGSTGQPKRCTHDMATLLREAQEHARRLRPKRILGAVPTHHIYGFLFTVLVPEYVGCDVLDIRARLPDLRDGDVIVSFPDHWRFLHRSLSDMTGVVGVTSTAPMPRDLAEDLRVRGLQRLIEIYGSTETAGIGWRDDPDAPFTLLEQWRVAAAPGNEGDLQLLAADGRLISTPDAVAMVETGLGTPAFSVRRRLDGAVQVGGVNVYPARIAAMLEQHPLVAHARVRLAAPEAGGRLKALIVPRDPSMAPADVQKAIAPWMAQQFDSAECPRSLFVTYQLPRGSLAKDCDWEVS